MFRVFSLLITLLFLNLASFLTAQDFAAIDQRAASFAATEDLATTAQQLVAPYETELEKARAIFIYVATSIKYDCRDFHREPKDRKARTKQEITQRAFTKGMGVCSGYAYLFDAMSKAAGLNSQFIGGTSRTGNQRYRPDRMPGNHAWNAIEIDGRWYLLDATWAAGYTNPEVTKFTAAFDDRFFMQDPEDFFHKHFPQDSRWQLLDEPRSAEEFLAQPNYFRLPEGWEMQDHSPREDILPTGETALLFRMQLTGPDKLFLTMGTRRFEMEKDEEGYYSYTLKRSEVRGRVITLRALTGTIIRPVIEYRMGR